MSDQLANFAHSFVATAPVPATTGTTLTVQSGHGALFPTVPFNVTIWPVGVLATSTNAEIATCTNVTGDVLTIVREQEGTTARTVVAGDQVAQTVSKAMLETLETGVAIERFGNYVDANTLFDAAFTAAAAHGGVIRLTAGRTYYVSQGIDVISGLHLICVGGMATIKFKTGAGGFNEVTGGGDRLATDRCFFSCDGINDAGIENVRFETDGVAETYLWVIRTVNGFSTKPLVLRNLQFTGFSAGELICINACGEAAYIIEDIRGIDCGASEGNTYYSASTVQLTLIALDADLGSPPVYSAPGFMRNIGVSNFLHTGDAFTDFGQQTDCFNHQGMDSTERGPVIVGIYADGVGEVADIFGSHTVIKGINARNVHVFVVKLIHGARFNDIEVETVESCGLAAIAISGSTASVNHTEYNSVRAGTIRGVGTAGAEPGSTAAVLFFGGTQLAKNNVVALGSVFGDGASMDYVVLDGTADSNNANLVEVGRASGWAVTFCSADPDNVRIRFKQSTNVRLKLPSTQTITTATPAVVDFSSVDRDINSEAVTGSDKVRCKFPGRKAVYAQVRLSGHAAGAIATLSILLNGSPVATTDSVAPTANDQTFSIQGIVMIAENGVDAAGADISIQVTVTSSGTLTLSNNSDASFFEVIDLD